MHRALPYGKRLQVAARCEQSRATLAGVALAVRALGHLVGRAITPAEITFPDGGKPRLVSTTDLGGGPDFSIAHAGPWVGCAALAQGLVGFDIELGADARVVSWACTEAALKACGAGISEARAVQLDAGRALYRGQVLYAASVELFRGAAACVVTSCSVQQIEPCAVALPELFAPWSFSSETSRP